MTQLSANQAARRAVLITVVLLLLAFGLYQGGRWLLRSPTLPGSSPQPTPEQRIAADGDNDGLPDLFETYYRTDATKPDTDADGVSDLEELDLGRDPTIAAPGDESKPPTGKAVPSLGTYTQRYVATLPDDAPREEVLKRERLEAFINEERGPLLPQLPAGTIKTALSSGKGAVSAYLDSISPKHTDKLTEVTNTDIEQALVDRFAGKPEAMEAIIARLERNIAVLKDVPAPEEVVALHTKLIAATQALLDNVKLLRDISTDFVGGLIGSKNVEELGSVFGEIAAEVAELEKKYDLAETP